MGHTHRHSLLDLCVSSLRRAMLFFFVSFQFYANAALHPHKDYTPYVQGKHIDYRPFVINHLLHLIPLSRCSIQHRRGIISMTEQMCEVMKNEFCQPEAKWVTVKDH